MSWEHLGLVIGVYVTAIALVAFAVGFLIAWVFT